MTHSSVLAVLAELEDTAPAEEPEQWPDDRIKTFPTDKEMLGAIGAARGMTSLHPADLTTNVTGAAKGFTMLSTSRGQQPPGALAQAGDSLLMGADKMLGAGGKFYTPGSGYKQ